MLAVAKVRLVHMEAESETETARAQRAILVNDSMEEGTKKKSKSQCNLIWLSLGVVTDSFNTMKMT